MTSLGLTEPPPATELAAHPYLLWEGDPLYRVCQRIKGTWWFSYSGAWRFDLVGTGSGTCYLSTDTIGALVEVFRQQPVDPDDIRKRVTRKLVLAERKWLADTTDLRARQYGMTKEIGTTLDYGLTQRWARKFDEADFDGVHSVLRHDVRPVAAGVSLFGPAGAAPDDDWESDCCELDLEAADLEAAGIKVLDVPHLATLTLLS